MGVNVGSAYSDEGKLLMELLERSGEGLLPCGTKIVGDRLYGMRVKLLEKMEGMGYEPLVYSRDTVWVRVRSEVRKRAHEKAMRDEGIMRGRYRIEQVFGSIKRAYGSYLEVRTERMARLLVLGMFIMWNLVGVLLWGGGFLFFVLFWRV